MFPKPYTLDKVKNLRYGSISKSGLKDFFDDKENSIFKDFDLSKYLKKSFPPNESVKTYQEIKTIDSLPANAAYVKKYDKIGDAFKQVFIKHHLSYPDKKIKQLLKDSVPIIKILKHTFNRPRPKQLAPYYDIKLGSIVNLSSMKTPSYPSGHSVQGYLIAHVLADEYPDIEEEFLEVAGHISKSRNIGRAHYFSDSKLGKQLGVELYKFLKSKEG